MSRGVSKSRGQEGGGHGAVEPARLNPRLGSLSWSYRRSKFCLDAFGVVLCAYEGIDARLQRAAEAVAWHDSTAGDARPRSGLSAESHTCLVG